MLSRYIGCTYVNVCAKQHDCPLHYLRQFGKRKTQDPPKSLIFACSTFSVHKNVPFADFSSVDKVPFFVRLRLLLYHDADEVKEVHQV